MDRAGRVAHRLRHAEIGDHGMPAGKHDVVRLDVAVHDAMRVRVRQRIDDVDQNAQCLADRERATLLKPLAERLPVDVRHHEEQDAPLRSGDLSRVVERQDVRVLESREGLDLAQEPRAAERCGEVLAKHLDRDLTIVSQVVREVHGGHAARTQLAVDAIASRE
jgi:hypothetical protein